MTTYKDWLTSRYHMTSGKSVWDTHCCYQHCSVAHSTKLGEKDNIHGEFPEVRGQMTVKLGLPSSAEMHGWICAEYISPLTKYVLRHTSAAA